MDTLMRIYISYNDGIPSGFIKALSEKEIFYSLGYSFLNGFLSRGGGNES
jgi:CRISPR-associated protein Cst1